MIPSHRPVTLRVFTLHGQAEQMNKNLKVAAACAAPEAGRSEALRGVIREIPLEARMGPADVFWKQAELQILQSIALAIMGRTAEF